MSKRTALIHPSAHGELCVKWTTLISLQPQIICCVFGINTLINNANINHSDLRLVPEICSVTTIPTVHPVILQRIEDRISVVRRIFITYFI